MSTKSKLPAKKKKNKINTTKRNNFNELHAYKTVIKSTILGGIFLVFSIIFNNNLISLALFIESIGSFLDLVIKIITILLFFIFMVISIGNYKELIGNPMNFKDLLLVFILSLIQGFRNPIVLGFTFIGLLIIIFYLYAVQEF